MFSPRDLFVSTGSATAVAAMHRFEEELLDYGTGAGVIFEAVAADPECGLAQAMAASAYLFKLTAEGNAQAAPHLAAAAGARADTARERALIAAIRAWADDRADTAVALLTETLRAHPTDLFAAKLLHFHQLNNGDAAGMLATSRILAPHHADDARVHGMHAFALDQTGDRRGAERAARRALAIADDPWAHHAMAHVFDGEGRAEEGHAWMLRHADAWARCSSFLYTHNWWHAALFCIDRGDHAGALALYDRRVWTMRKGYAQDQINAVSLLSRLELAGVAVGERWIEVADHLEQRAGEAVNGFLDLHYAYALARAGCDERVRDLVGAAERHRVAPAGWRRVMPVAARALIAHARGRHDAAARHFADVGEALVSVGGSTTQREWFAQLQFDALLRTDRRGEAERLLAARYPAGPRAVWKQRLHAELMLPADTLLAA